MGTNIGILLDLDGVLVKDKKLNLFGDTTEFLNFLRERGIPFRVVSNNSRVPPKVLKERLAQKGLVLKEGELITALAVAPDYLRRFNRVLAFCEEEVKEYLRGEGVNLTDEPSADAVFIAQNHGVTFEDIKKVTTALKVFKAKLVAVNTNKLAKDSDGLYYPATGSWVKMFVHATDYPESEVVSLGKPSEEFFKLALKGFEDKEVYFASDDFYTDLIPAEKYNLKTVFVTTGKYSKEDIAKAQYRPFAVVNSLRELKSLLEKALK
ncbi:MAG: hydrolase [Aquificaceae bacterium]|nr:MAG: hydrolase [Aquificaceae bacterium]